MVFIDHHNLDNVEMAKAEIIDQITSFELLPLLLRRVLYLRR